MSTNQVVINDTSKCDKTKYKTEMCKNWIESDGQYCRYGDKCQFAHGNHEKSLNLIPNNNKYKSKNCVQFHHENNFYCPYGMRCQFRHEERNFEEIHELYYVQKLNKLIVEKTFGNSSCNRRLRVFEEITDSEPVPTVIEYDLNNQRSSPQLSASKPPH